jgi:hypothetical protein
MIVHLDKQQQRTARRQLLGDEVYVLSHDALKKMHGEGLIALSPVEVFLSAQNFCNEILGLTDIEEGLEDEMDDLEDEAESKNDFTLVLALSAAILQAISKKRTDFNPKPIIFRIYERLDGQELLWPLIEQMTDKEEARWLEGKKTNLLDYELQEIMLSGGGSVEISRLFEDFIRYADKMGEGTIKDLLTFLNRYNNDHNHAYDKEIDLLYEKMGIKNSSIINANELVMTKNVVNEVNGVASGATGMTINNSSK